jgi:hypothetical protein
MDILGGCTAWIIQMFVMFFLSLTKFLIHKDWELLESFVPGMAMKQWQRKRQRFHEV